MKLRKVTRRGILGITSVVLGLVMCGDSILNSKNVNSKENLNLHAHDIRSSTLDSKLNSTASLEHTYNLLRLSVIPLNKLNNGRFVDNNTAVGNYLTKLYSKNKDNYDIAYDSEKTSIFEYTNNYHGAFADQNVTVLHNLFLIDALEADSVYYPANQETVKFDKILHKDYIPLKKLLRNLKKISKTKDSNLEKFIKQYNLVAKTIKAGKITDASEGLFYLTTGNLGDCSDLTPAYYTLLKRYYDFDMKMVFSKVPSEKENPLHTWLNVTIDGSNFDLDPTWYPFFVPLNPRLDYNVRPEYKEDALTSKKDYFFRDWFSK
jgi:hypothetical protein